MDVPGEPPTAPIAGDTRLEGQPGDGPCCDGTGELAWSNAGLPQTRSGGDGYRRGRGCGGGRSPGDEGEDVPCEPPTATQAGDTRKEGQPSDEPCCDGGGEPVGSNDGLPQMRSGGDGYWRGRGCSGGRSHGDEGTDVPCEPPTAPIAGDTRQDGQPGDGPCYDGGGELAGSNGGLPQTRSGGDGYWRGRGCSGGRSPVHEEHVRFSGYARSGQDHGEEPRELEGTRQGYVASLGADLGVVDFGDDGELVEWWQDREDSWDSATVLDDCDSVQTGDGYTQVHKTVLLSEDVDERPLDPEGQLLVWGRLFLLPDSRGAVHQVPVELDADYRQFAAWCTKDPEHVIFVAGATVLVRGVTLRAQGVAPGMLLEMRARLTGGAGDSHPLAALAVFGVQKYETWREHLAGSLTTAGALTRAIEKMIGRFKGNLPSLLTDVSVNCPGPEPEHLWTLLGCFEMYACALLDFPVMRYVQVHREEYHDPDDCDALQEARKEYDEIEHEVRLEGADRKEHEDRMGDPESNDEEERQYEVLNLENVRKIRKRPGAPEWTVRLSKALRDYLQQPGKGGEHNLANAVWDIMRNMDRQGSTYLKEA